MPAPHEATVASVTVRRDALNKVRDELRALASKTALPELANAHQEFMAALREVADGADTLAQALTAGLAARDEQLDLLSMLVEAQSWQLQTKMDRSSKTVSTLSNLLKKESETARAICQNLK